MTDMEIKPGRELDALVAEKVMGLVCGKDWHDPCFDPQFCDQPLHSYSTSISAAWEVVEKLRERDHSMFGISWNLDGTGWECEFMENATDHWVAYSNTAPHAICLAALKAVEGK